MGDTHFFFESWKYFQNFPQSWNFARRVSPHKNITKTLKIKQIQVFKLSYNIYLYHSFSFKITVHPKCITSQHLSFKLRRSRMLKSLNFKEMLIQLNIHLFWSKHLHHIAFKHFSNYKVFTLIYTIPFDSIDSQCILKFHNSLSL